MNRIFCIVGKSGSGKDTLYKKIVGQENPQLVPVIPYTTRPKRQDEIEGLNYHFVTEQQMHAFENSGQVLEKREYHTVHGIWTYFTVTFELTSELDYITITTLDGVFKLIEHYGEALVYVIYLQLEDRERLIRCINREALQEKPNFSEVCRRFLADEADFSPERLKQLKHLYPVDTGRAVEQCVGEVSRILER